MFNKLWVAVGGTLAMLLHGLLTDDGHLSGYDWATFLIQAVTAILVWYVANGPRGGVNWAAKFVVAAWSAAGAVFLPAFADGVVTGDEWSKVAVSVATAVLVFIVPNKDSVPPTPLAPPGSTRVA